MALGDRTLRNVALLALGISLVAGVATVVVDSERSASHGELGGAVDRTVAKPMDMGIVP